MYANDVLAFSVVLMCETLNLSGCRHVMIFAFTARSATRGFFWVVMVCGGPLCRVAVGSGRSIVSGVALNGDVWNDVCFWGCIIEDF